MYDIQQSKRKEVDGMDENKDKEKTEEVTETMNENKTEEVEEVDETTEDKDEQQEDSETEEQDNQDEEGEETEEETDAEGDGLTEEEREYYTNEIEKLDNELFEIKEAKALETVKERMKAAKYTNSQIERYAHLIDKDNIQQSINELKIDIPPKNHKYVEPSLDNGARQNINNPGKAGQLHEIGRAMARYVSNKGKRR